MFVTKRRICMSSVSIIISMAIVANIRETIKNSTLGEINKSYLYLLYEILKIGIVTHLLFIKNIH